MKGWFIKKSGHIIRYTRLNCNYSFFIKTAAKIGSIFQSAKHFYDFNTWEHKNRHLWKMSICFLSVGET